MPSWRLALFILQHLELRESWLLVCTFLLGLSAVAMAKASPNSAENRIHVLIVVILPGLVEKAYRPRSPAEAAGETMSPERVKGRRGQVQRLLRPSHRAPFLLGRKSSRPSGRR